MKKNKIATIQLYLKESNIDVYLIPKADHHSSEYIPEVKNPLLDLIDFIGTAGTIGVYQNRVVLFVDARYTTEAENQFKNTDIEVVEVVSLVGTVFNNALGIDVKNIAVDFSLLSSQKFNDLEIHFTSVVHYPYEGMKEIVPGELEFLNEEVSGESTLSKLDRTRSQFDTDGLLISALDDIAWLLNVRGHDVPCNPVFYSYVLITHDECMVFSDHTELSKGLKSNENFSFYNYSELSSIIQTINLSSLTIDQKSLNHQLCVDLSENCSIISKSSIVAVLKSVKNKVELEGMKEAQLLDLKIWSNTFSQLDELKSQQEVLALHLKNRKEQLSYRWESFEPIIGMNENGAVIHYRTSSSPDKELEEGLLLVDMGGHYSKGTTDMTRVFLIGEANEKQIKTYTVVLKALIALTTKVFQSDTDKMELHTYCKSIMQEFGMDYPHGTGHGVGHYLNVHEGPLTIGPSGISGEIQYQSGNIITIEPGCYYPGEFGIRLENVCEIVENQEGLMFEPITFFPFEYNLIDQSLLSIKEKEWMSNYHIKVLESHTIDWLKEKCEPFISRD